MLVWRFCIYIPSTNSIIIFSYLQTKGDRFYLNGRIKIEIGIVAILKGMNMNFLTSGRDHDYRFMSRLITALFTEDEIAAGCVRMDSSSPKNIPYKLLDDEKVSFVKGIFLVIIFRVKAYYLNLVDFLP